MNSNRWLTRSFRYDFRAALLFAWLCILIMPQMKVFAAQPTGPVTGVVPVDREESWSGSIVFSGEGRLVVSGKLSLENAVITFTNTGNAMQPAITVQDGASLSIKNSTLKLAGLGNREAIVSNKAEVTIDHSEISGADCLVSTALIRINGGKFHLLNGSSITNNRNRGMTVETPYGIDREKFTGSIIKISDSEVTIEDSSIAQNTTGFVESCGSSSGRCIRAVGSEILEIDNSQISMISSSFKNNVGSDLSVHVIDSTFDIESSTFDGGSHIIDWIGLFDNIRVEKSILHIKGNSIFSNNIMFGINDCEMSIDDNVVFRDNSGETTIEAHNSQINIGKALFQNNSGRVGAVAVYGGELILNGTSFIENHGDWGPGAVSVDAGYNLFTNEITPAKLVINQAEFIGNSSYTYKSATLSLGGVSFWTSASYFNNYAALCTLDKLWEIFREHTDFTKESCDYFYNPPYTEEEIRHLVQAEIHSAVFQDNKMNFIISDLDMVGGGAIYISPYAHLKMDSTAIVNNRIGDIWKGDGAGIAAGPVSETYIYPRKGAAIFANDSNDLSQPLQDLVKLDNDVPFTFPQKMFNGGYHNWSETEDHNILTWFYTSWTERNALDPLHLDGTVYGSNPTKTNIEDASIVIQNNQIGVEMEKEHISEEEMEEFMKIAFGYGAGIYNDGILEIGEPGAVFTVTKVWNDDENSAGRRPTPQTLLSSLILFADGKTYPLGTIIPAPYSPEPDNPAISVYDAAGDIYVMITVEEKPDNTWLITFDGLPKFNEDGSQIVWTVDEKLRNYTAEVSGDMENGFMITNEPKPEEEAESMTFYRFFEQLETLPRTGFSALQPQMLAAKPQDLNYKPTRITLEIPSLSVSVPVVEVPYDGSNYAVEWLGDSAGLLEGSALPGKGISILTGHNHLNSTEAGPFAFLSEIQAGDRVFVLNAGNVMQSFTVYASEQLAENDVAGFLELIGGSENTLALITCEDERPEGGYENRRIIAAIPTM